MPSENRTENISLSNANLDTGGSRVSLCVFCRSGCLTGKKIRCPPYPLAHSRRKPVVDSTVSYPVSWCASSRLRQEQVFECGYSPLSLDEWEGMKSSATVVCVRGRYTTYLDRETFSLFFHDQVFFLACVCVFVRVCFDTGDWRRSRNA